MLGIFLVHTCKQKQFNVPLTWLLSTEQIVEWNKIFKSDQVEFYRLVDTLRLNVVRSENLPFIYLLSLDAYVYLLYTFFPPSSVLIH